MFKPSKAISIKESRALSGKDVKTLRKKIETQFALEGEPFSLFSFSIKKRRSTTPPPSTLTSNLTLLLRRFPLSPPSPNNRIRPHRDPPSKGRGLLTQALEPLMRLGRLRSASPLRPRRPRLGLGAAAPNRLLSVGSCPRLFCF